MSKPFIIATNKMKKIVLRASATKNPQVRSYLSAVKRGKKSQHVVPSDSGWKVKTAGSSRAKTCKTQKEAILVATKIAKTQKTELFIHGRDGKIRERSSYGKDPFPPKG